MIPSIWKPMYKYLMILYAQAKPFSLWISACKGWISSVTGNHDESLKATHSSLSITILSRVMASQCS